MLNSYLLENGSVVGHKFVGRWDNVDLLGHDDAYDTPEGHQDVDQGEVGGHVSVASSSSLLFFDLQGVIHHRNRWFNVYYSDTIQFVPLFLYFMPLEKLGM